MALDPMATNFVHIAQLIELLPELDVFYRFASAVAPAELFPAIDPFSEAFDDILAVGIEIDFAGAIETFQTADDGDELHAVIGGHGFAA